MSIDTRERLLEAAMVVFAEAGYEKATVRDICERAGANVAAVNYHFGDKQRLYCEAIGRAHARCHAAVTPLGLAADVPAATKLRAYVGQLLAAMMDDEIVPHHRQLMLQEMARPTMAISELVRDRVAHEYALLLNVVGELAGEGCSLERRQMIAFSIVGQCLFYKIARPVIEALLGAGWFAAEHRARLAEHVAQVALAALGAGPPVVGLALEGQEEAGT